MIKNKFLTVIFFSCCTLLAYSQEDSVSDKSNLSIAVNYYNSNNQFQYLTANVKAKINEKFEVISDIPLKFYIDSESEKNLLGTAVSGYTGNATVYIPALAKDLWNNASTQKFIAVADETNLFNAAEGEVEIVKAKLQIDTAEDKKIVVKAMELKDDSSWIPVAGVDVIVAVKRLDGDLNVDGETATYTTDSLGMVSAEYLRENLPGDSKGNIILIAKVEDNDNYGNLSIQQTVPWGAPSEYTSTYNERTLYSRRGKSPIWLELMAYGTILAVWSVLIYLAFQIKKIKKLGAY
jgi:hypothetical protein